MVEKYLWKPTQDVVDHSNIGRFMKRHGIADYRDLIARSSREIEWFWNAVVEDLGIEFYRPFRNFWTPATAFRGRAGLSAARSTWLIIASTAMRDPGAAIIRPSSGKASRAKTPAYLCRVACRRPAGSPNALRHARSWLGAMPLGCSCRWSRKR